MRSQQSARFAVADDCSIFAEAAVRLLRESFDLADDACTALSPFTAEAVPKTRPDLLILDPLFVRPLDRLVPEWRAQLPSLRLFAFATQPTIELARFCLGLGFNGFLPKTADSVTLVRAVGVVAKGGHFMDKAYGRQLMADRATQDMRPLTMREQDVLKRTSLGYSNREIARSLDLSPKTVDSHRARGMAKLALSERSELVRFAAANGWLS
ncbi:two component LuxR family transcriptional regulator [Roseivivax marinus]|uniref:Two component LuxR family transcriptional regulator n=1 Tax=Roseivivax marinus TaxID=1379903 RepID=W4HPT2_9RHOB|nr:response regulator transcription factor [Roseivivax marinus]ETW14777.1 two component LuxR family transcriptional regulator [Roseivivax marinus]UMA65995.1 response regulator transcription factor [Roseivivax marinus]